MHEHLNHYFQTCSRDFRRDRKSLQFAINPIMFTHQTKRPFTDQTTVKSPKYPLMFTDQPLDDESLTPTSTHIKLKSLVDDLITDAMELPNLHVSTIDIGNSGQRCNFGQICEFMLRLSF